MRQKETRKNSKQVVAITFQSGQEPCIEFMVDQILLQLLLTPFEAPQNFNPHVRLWWTGSSRLMRLYQPFTTYGVYDTKVISVTVPLHQTDLQVAWGAKAEFQWKIEKQIYFDLDLRVIELRPCKDLSRVDLWVTPFGVPFLLMNFVLKCSICRFLNDEILPFFST